MSVKRHFICDLCHSEIRDMSEGIGIRWQYQSIKNVLIHDAEHHLCNKCCTGLETMFAGIEKPEGILQQVDAVP